MPHTLVLARFHPGASAYWLPPSGRLAAKKVQTVSFLAIRFNLHEGPEHKGYAAQDALCAISPLPSPLPFSDASFTLGPKRAYDAPALVVGDSQLTVLPPLWSTEAGIRQPVYLHTVPCLVIANTLSHPIKRFTHQLDPVSFQRFQAAVLANAAALRQHWKEQRTANLANRLPHWLSDSHGNDELSTFSDGDDGDGDPTYMFGQLNNPHMYSFRFNHDLIPCSDTLQPPNIYNEMLEYAQVCKDYRWWGVEATIQWVREMREETRPVEPAISQPDHGDAHELLKHDPTLCALAQAVHKISFSKERIYYDDDSDVTHSIPLGPGVDSQGSYVVGQFLPFAFPVLPVRYPRVSLGRPGVVVFDVLGTMLDREGAIRGALASWARHSRRPRCLEEIVALYVELEALAARRDSNCSVSLPVLVHSALDALAAKLGVHIPSHTGLLSDTVAAILNPKPYHDVETALSKLAQEGCTAVGLLPHTIGTMDLETLLPTLPRRLVGSLQIVPIPIPIHFPVPDKLFPTVTEWCKRTQPGLQAADILVASNGMGRIVGPASINGHPTALVKRPGGIESAVPFVVGHGTETPAPSTVVESLEELCRVVFA